MAPVELGGVRMLFLRGHHAAQRNAVPGWGGLAPGDGQGSGTEHDQAGLAGFGGELAAGGIKRFGGWRSGLWSHG